MQTESRHATSQQRRKRGLIKGSVQTIFQYVSVLVEVDADQGFCLQIDMEKLAENMQKMTEDDLLLVVQMIHDNKTADTWTKNDVDRKLWIWMVTRYARTNELP